MSKSTNQTPMTNNPDVSYDETMSVDVFMFL